MRPLKREHTSDSPNPNRVIRFTIVGTTATSTTAWSGQIFTPRGNGNGTISWLAFDPTNELTVYATVSNFNGTPNAQGTSAGHVFKSTNGGQTWASIDGHGANAMPGNTGTVGVTKSAAATGQCDWTAVSNSDFITVNSGATGNGTGAVGFTVAPNATGAARTGTLTVAGQTVTITQDAAPVAAADAATTDEDTPVNVGVLTNDSDPDGDVLSLVSVTQGASGVTFELFKSNNMSDTPDRVVSGVAVNASGETLPATIDNMAADTYVVKVKVDSANGYWTASPVGVATVNVTVGSNDQRVNGGGWVADSGSADGKSNFGFTVRGEKGMPKGNFVYVFRGADGFTYVVKNNAWQGGFLNFAGEVGTSALTRASFKGRCNVQKVDPATGATVQSWGNFTFTADVRDGDLLDPRQADGFAITIQDNGGAVWRQVGTGAALVALGGGNVHVKGK
jgi:catechol 2,3-dioxygenase-like lactoylglutathione lyase family enzyme